MDQQRKKTKVLIVDDDPDMRIFFSTLLKTDGFYPIVARNGTEGMAKAKSQNPEFIIIDVPMPGNGGMQMYQGLKQDDRLKFIPVMMVSTIDKQTFTHYQKTKGIRLGTDIKIPEGFVEKPPEAKDVLDLIKDILLGDFPKSDRNK